MSRGGSSAEFIESTWNMVNARHAEIGWSTDGSMVVVSNAERLAEHILPQYFRHGQYASWVRALNAYDFKKTGAGRWSHPSFVRGHPELLKNIKRKAPPSRSGGRAGPVVTGAAGAGASSSTSLAVIPRRSRAPTSPDVELRQQYWWMQQELSKLENEVVAIKAEEFQQRFDTVRLMQVMLSQLTHKPQPGGEPQIVLNPAVISGQGAMGGTGHNQLTYRGEARVDEVGSVAADGLDDARPARNASDLPQVERNVSEGGVSLPSLPSVGASSLPSFDISELEIDGIASSQADGGWSGGGAGGGAEGGVGASASMPLVDEEASTSPPLGRLPPRPEVADGDDENEDDDAAMLRLEDILDAEPTPMASSPISPMEPRLWTSGGAAGSGGGLSGGGLSGNTIMSAASAAAANTIMSAFANPAASSNAMQLTSVLSRMPQLPASTRELPPRGTVQRQHIEAAIELAFQQLTLTASQAVAAQQSV